MPKPNKSSASSGTRKKHAKKAAGQDDPDGPGQQKRKPQRGEKKLSKAQKRAQPKIKQYVPPPKPPAPPIPDPLDGQGLARTLPADLVVILRRLGKKDDVTRRKGLDELKEWVEGIKSEQDEVEKETKEVTLTSAVPVWVSVSFEGTREGLMDSCTTRPVYCNLHLTARWLFLCIPSCYPSPRSERPSPTHYSSVFCRARKTGMCLDHGL
jgi:hypothetical protein